MMKKKIEYQRIWKRTKAMLLSPRKEWPGVHEEQVGERQLFREYLLPWAAAGMVCTLVLLLMRGRGLMAIGMAGINFAAALTGWYVTYRLTREYLSGKVERAGLLALQLATYGYGVYIGFSSLAAGFSPNFLGQLMEVGSLLCVHTLYVGLETAHALNQKYRSNVLIIAAVLMIAVPAIVERLLTILFRIPTLYA